MSTEIKIRIQVTCGESSTFVSVDPGSNLREVLLKQNLSPYRGAFQKLNCQGLGVCGSCKVFLKENGSDWERRSCQIQCFQDMEIRLQ